MFAYLLLGQISLISGHVAGKNSTYIPKPGPQQINAIGFELEMFIHFSINTFTK